MGDINILERILSGVEKPTDLALALLLEITENFSEKRKIGRGGFAEVYKGVFQNSSIAVKRITVSEHTVDDKLFYQEVKNLMKIIICHRNVVRFLGFCSNTHREAITFPGSADLVFIEKRERLLCFEYISNRSLDEHITDELRGLEWSARYEIIKGICHGLHYLHEENNIIHMDLKPSNIMIDDNMVPKITDFGLSRLDRNTHTSGTRYLTHGYCAPEYENGGKTSKKVDMYSLGVIIAELVTGRKGDPYKVNVLRRWIHRWNMSPKRKLFPQYQQLVKCMEIAALCRKKEPADRPSILDIIDILGKTESSNEHTDQISLYLNDGMLGVKPLELCFPFEIRKQISSIVNLINRTKNYYAFNIEKPREQYLTKPNKGIVPPQSECNIQIIMQTQDTTPQGLPYTDDFIVWSTKVDGDLRVEDITEQLFNREPVEVDEVNFMVVVYEPGEPKGDLKSRGGTKNKMVEYAFGEDKPGIRATREAEVVLMETNYVTYENARGQYTKQLEHLSFHATPSISPNQHIKISNRAVDLANGAMGSLHHKLGNLLKEEYNLEISVNKEIESLLEELMEMQLALHKVLEVHRDYIDVHVKHWADTVREMSYEIEDVVDGFLVHIEHASNTSFFMGLMQNMFSLFMLGKSHNPIGDTIKDMKKQVQVVANRRIRCKVDEVVAHVPMVITSDPRILAIYKDKKELTGIKEPRNKLIKWLCDEDGDEDLSKHQLKIVSIVGFGGLGKTTLAKAVYDKLQSQFHPMAFVPVGRNPNVKKVLMDILNEIGYGSMTPNMNETQIIDEIRIRLKNKRYLIVIDDIWDSSAWNYIKCAFTEGNCRSSVVTTTRIQTVANDCCRHSRGYVHEMKPLNDQDSRKLFVGRIFGTQEGFVPSEILNDILKKCGGLPLAIISIASLLAHSPMSRWDSVRKSLVSIFEENHDDLKNMEQVLDLSYMHLPRHLKTCMLDIGKYREDCEIKKKDLLRHWTAQGFVSTTPLRDPEDVAEDYFYRLINMSMIQPGKMYNDEVLSCRVHDIMLDLIRAKAAEENFNLVIDGPEIVIGVPRRVRRVSIHYVGEEQDRILAAINGSLSHVRSVLLFKGSLLPSFLVLKYIRVLQLEDGKFEGLDVTGICGLFLLRYLKIRCAKDLTLPSQIGELRQLETIEVEIWDLQRDEPSFLPSDIITLPRLLHLSYRSYSDGSSSDGVVLPDEIGRLKSLRTLRGVAFLDSSVENVKGLGELTNLRELEMFSRNRICDEVDTMRVNALLSSIGKLSGNLKNLIIGINFHIILLDHGWSSTITPPRRLHKLDLTSCRFHKIPEWIAQLHELYFLKLSIEEVADAVRVVAGLPSLALLELHKRMPSNIWEEKVVISGRGFRALKHLFWGCPYVPLVFQAGALPRLERLSMWFHEFMSAEFIPFGIEHLPSGTLQHIHLQCDSDDEEEDDEDGVIEQRKAAIGQLLKSAFELHHPSAHIKVY